MITLSVGQVILLVVMTAAGLGAAYNFGRINRRKSMRVTLGTLPAAGMTDTEKARMRDAFDHLSKAYDAIRDFYREQ